MGCGTTKLAGVRTGAVVGAGSDVDAIEGVVAGVDADAPAGYEERSGTSAGADAGRMQVWERLMAQARLRVWNQTSMRMTP